MLKKKKTTASGKLVLVKSVRRTRSHRMKFCVQRGLGALPSTSKRRGKSRRDFLPCGPVCINTGIACQYYHGKFIGSVILAVLGVACQMVPYFCVAHIVTMMLSGEQNFSRYVTAGIIALCGYFGKVLFSCLSTTISHTATYYTLRDLRENITAKLARVPMGTILDTPSGQYKTTIVDRVEGMESTFAHLIPEMTANVLVPLVIAVYLFLLDWRMALLSLVTLVVGLAVMSAGMKNYPVKWEGAVKAGKQMANAIVEYIGGIEVVKAFSQSAGSYKKYSDAVNYNANYYVDWMRENQKTMSA